MENSNFVADIIEEIPATNAENTNTESESDDDENEFTFDDQEYADDDVEEYIHIGDSTSDDIERIVDALGGIFVNADGETICDVLTNINDNIDKHNKLMYRISCDIRKLLAQK